jgi:microcystin-dependent protein
MSTITPGGTPVGSVLMYAGGTDGSSIYNLFVMGWALCDGATYPTTQFPELFSVIGESYGGGDGTYAVPTYKGLFVRGVDANDPLARDPEASKRTAPRADLANHGNGGPAVGSLQMDQLESHTHGYKYYNAYVKSTHTLGNESLSGQAPSSFATSGAASDTRPVNQYVNFIIKASSATDGVPFGAVMPFAGDIAKSGAALAKAGWLFCNGAPQSTGGASGLPALYQVISNYYGADNQSNFRLPDFRGKFLRGVVGQLIPGTVSLDPEYLTRTPPQPGLPFKGNSGNQVGSMQATGFAAHTHSYTYNNDYWETAGTLVGFTAEAHKAATWTSDANSSLKESRPINIGVNYIIKASVPSGSPAGKE